MSLITHADVAIVGGGAAGLAAGIFAGEAAGSTRRSIVIFDGAKEVGAKILVSGGGRCNVTHREMHPGDFHGSPILVRNILAAFPLEATREWFASLGVELKEEQGGKLFPVTDRARTVLDALLGRLRDLHVQLLTRHRIATVEPALSGSEGWPAFVLRHDEGQVTARRVILATGGQSLPRTGSDGRGWRIAARLGHSITPVAPALVPLVLDSAFFHAELSGVSQAVTLTTRVEGKTIDRRTGDLLWTHFGVSGPVVLDVSRFWTLAILARQKVEIRCSFVPASDSHQLEQQWLRLAAERPKASVRTLMSTYVTERVALALLRHCDLDPSQPASQLPRELRSRLLQALYGLVLPVVKDRGWNHAEVTAGGVPLEEINFRTMESRLVPGLYVIGEMLDCDGRIGGFNFQWAWATGRLAGCATVASLRAQAIASG